MLTIQLSKIKLFLVVTRPGMRILPGAPHKKRRDRPARLESPLQ